MVKIAMLMYFYHLNQVNGIMNVNLLQQIVESFMLKQKA